MQSLEMAQWLRVLAGLAEAMVPITDMVIHTHSQLQFQGIQRPLQTSAGTRHARGAHAYIHTYMHTYIQAKHSYT